MVAHRILTGLDGSDESRRALECAIDLARALEAELVVVHALGLLERLDEGAPVPTASHRGEIVDTFETRWCAPVAEAGLDARLLTREGSPVDVLLALAEQDDPDFIVVGSRGIGGATPQALGSTSHELAARSKRPVVIVPADR